MTVAHAVDVPIWTAAALTVPLAVRFTAVTVPLMFTAPLSVVVPMAIPVVQVEDTPATVPVEAGAFDSTTFPLPVEPVVQLIALPLVAVQKSPVVNVPLLMALLAPMLIQFVPLQ